MKAVINFQLLEDIQSYSFDPGFISKISERYRDVTCFDLDQLSGARTFEYALKVIAEADIVLFIISGKSNDRPYNLYSIAEAAFKKMDKFYVMDTLKDDKIVQYFRPLGKKFLSGKEWSEQEAFIINVLSPQT